MRAQLNNELQENTERQNWVDYAKGIGIILVVYGHVVRGLYSAGIPISERFYQISDSVIYSFHMPLFFFLSGLFFLSTYNKYKAGRSVLKKVDVVVYPYIIWSLLQGFIEVFLAQYTNGDVSASEVLRLWDPRAHFWFLYALFLIFSLCCVIFWAFKEVAIYVALLSSLVIYLWPSILPESTASIHISQNLVFFIAGIAFSRFSFHDFWRKKWLLYISIVAFFLSQYVFHVIWGGHYGDRGINTLLLALVSITLIVSLCHRLPDKGLSWLLTLGVSSMAIYLIHILSGSGVRILLQSLLSINNFWVHLALGMVFGLLLPIVFSKAVEKIGFKYIFSAPISRWVQRFGKK
ncbi:acyltransferase [bacterium SCSIO 12696]|nr:acyltransferase [bacterium SCSIO 12696]